MKTLALASLLLAACAETPMVKTTLDAYALAAHPAPAPADGVAVAVEAISYDSLDKYPGASVNASWNERDQNQVNVGMQGAARTIERHAQVPMLPLPSLIVRVANHSSHALKLAGARFELKDDKGVVYKLYASANELEGRVSSDIQSTRPALADSQPAMEQINDKISKLPLLNRVDEIKSGEEWQGYLACDLKVHDAGELDALLSKLEHLTLAVDAKDEAGSAVALSATLDRTKMQVTMSCPQGAAPSVARCKPIQ